MSITIQNLLQSPVVPAKPWKKNTPPRSILAIRMHAIGDVVITMPYLQQLRNSLPLDTRIDFLTIREAYPIPSNIQLFNKVYIIGGGRNFKKQVCCSALLLPKLFFRHYDVVLDLQNGFISNWVRKILMPKAWSVFDKVSPRAAGERTRLTIEAAGLGENFADTHFTLKSDLGIEKILKENAWDEKCDLVILNPAGAFETRNWPAENYKQFAELWLQQFPATQFLIMGTDLIAPKSKYLKAIFGNSLINLVSKTTLAQAFAIIQKTKFVLSEDSGLMHMAWISGIPILALFGSTRSDWSRPLGAHSLLLNSSDLECGNCMLEVCKYGDVHCLTRYSPEYVFEKALILVK